MANRIFTYGRSKPPAKRRGRGKRHMHSAMKANQQKMKSCAVEWKKKGRPGKWINFVKVCMKRK